MIVFFIHFAFFLKVYKKEDNKQYLQKLYDFVFNQIDISLQEAGHGDTTINKKMKNYVSIFHSIIKKVDYWESLKNEEKTNFFSTFFEHSIESSYFVEYFEKYRIFLANNPLNHFLTCATGDSFIATTGGHVGDVVDMESYALAKVCLKFDISFIAFKYISDSADKDASIDWVENLKKGQKLFKKKVLEVWNLF